jgi:hypothetical protein
MATAWHGNFKPPNWDAPNWRPPTHTEPVVTVPVRAAFLDEFGRFAKREEDVTEVRLWAAGALPHQYTSLTIAEFDALTKAERDDIRNLGSGAGLVVTEGKSNA